MKSTTPPGESSPPTVPNSSEATESPVARITDHQLESATRIAEQRARSYRQIDGGRICGTLSNAEAHEIGVIGELAFADLYDTQLDDQIYERGDEGYDFDVNNCKIDIKTTQTESVAQPDLILPPPEKWSAHVYVLAHWQEDVVRFVGLAYRYQLQIKHPERYPAERENIVIRPEDLHPVPETTPPRCPGCRLRSILGNHV